MKTMREKGDLGEVYSIIGSYLQDWLFYATDYNWRLEPDKSGDSRAIADIGSHLLDVIEYITGLKTVEVMADFNTVHKFRKKPLKPVETYSGKMLKPEDYADVPINTEDHANVLLRFDNGNRGSVTVSQVSAGRKNQLKLEISGSNKTFAFITTGGTAAALSGQAPEPLSVNSSGTNTVIKKIAVGGSKRMGFKIYVVGKGICGMCPNNNIDFEEAIATGEIQSKGMSREQAISKLKEAKDLVDLGMMSKEDFEKLKLELTPIIIKN
jgi:predicted dehydrogenase